MQIDHDFRLAGIGSSDAPTIMETSKWNTPFELLLQKLSLIHGRQRHPKEIEAMQRGIREEPAARILYENTFGILMPAKFKVVHPQFPQIRANCDGFNLESNKVLEIKRAGKADHLTALKGKIPKHYFWQCIHLMAVTGADTCDYFSYDGEEGTAITLYRDHSIEERLVNAELRFWDWVESKRKLVSEKEILKSNVIQFRR